MADVASHDAITDEVKRDDGRIERAALLEHLERRAAARPAAPAPAEDAPAAGVAGLAFLALDAPVALWTSGTEVAVLAIASGRAGRSLESIIALWPREAALTARAALTLIAAETARAVDAPWACRAGRSSAAAQLVDDRDCLLGRGGCLDGGADRLLFRAHATAGVSTISTRRPTSS
jgi:hypothetical protein